MLKVTLTPDEVREACAEWLLTKGMDIPAERISFDAGSSNGVTWVRATVNTDATHISGPYR